MDDTRQALHAEGAHAPYGAYAPDALTRLVVALARHTPLGRGGARMKIRDFLRARCDGPIDGELFGVPVRCHFDENRCEWKAFLKPSMFDPQERAIVARYIDKADAVFLDIGANIGVHTLAASKAAWPDATILAFEPHPVTYGRLAFNVAQCGHPGVHAVQVALSDRDGFAVLGGEDLSLRSLALGGEGPQVRIRPLIDVLGEHAIFHIDAMKIDVEGHEDSVLKHFLDAAPDSLVPRLVIIEHLGRHVWSFDCIDALISRGMRIAKTAGNNTFLVRD